jgi:1-acyl-sn-glycerol-3-phosphate acyltransferase
MVNGKTYHRGINPKTGQAVSDDEFEFGVKPRLGALRATVSCICWALFKVVFPVKLEGQNHIPRTGGAVLAFTHIGPQDGLLTMGLCRHAYIFTKNELFKTPLQRFFLSRLGCIPVDRGKRNSQSLQLAENLLKNGATLAVFPEGTYNKTEKIRPLKYGAVSLAARANVPIVPVVSTGKYKLFRRSVQIEFTEPIMPNQDLTKANQALHERLQTVRSIHIKDQANKFQQSDGGLQVVLKPLLLALFRLIYRPQVIGAENVPQQGRVIVAANHKHDFDPFLIMMGRPGRRVHFLAKHQCIEWKVGRLISKFGVIFVDRQAKDKDFVNYTVLKLLGKERTIALFPEGTRNKTAEIMLPFKFGAVSYAQKSAAAIVPAAIVGRYRPFRKGLKIIFGTPIKLKPTDDLKKANQKLFQTIEKALLANHEPEYRKEIYKKYKERNLN